MSKRRIHITRPDGYLFCKGELDEGTGKVTSWDNGDTFDWPTLQKLRYQEILQDREPVKRWLWSYRDSVGVWCIPPVLYSESEAKEHIGGFDDLLKLEWSMTEFPE